MNKKHSKRLFALFIAAAVLLSGCSDSKTNDGINSSDTRSEPVGEVTTNKVSAVENQPEETPSATSAQSGGEVTDPPAHLPPELPIPYPTAAVENGKALEELKTVISSAETAMSIMYGSDTLIPLTSSESGGYRLISSDYAASLQALTDKMYEGIKYSFWEEHFGKEIEDILPDYIKETDSGVMLKMSTGGSSVAIDIDTAVITALDENTAEIKALGKYGGSYVWRTYDILNGVRGWVLREFSDEGVTGEISLFSQLLIGERDTLDKIFGSADPVRSSGGDWNTQLVTIENDPYGHGFYNGLEIDPFMTVEEMKQYIRDRFTKEIAESYISLYINRTYVEKDGKLYIISGSILPQMGRFSLDSYENRSVSGYDVTSFVDWTDGETAYRVPVTIAYEGGRWKIDTRLPMGRDRVIDTNQNLSS